MGGDINCPLTKIKIMRIKFSKDCTWEFKDGTIVMYSNGIADDITREEALKIIEKGFAVQDEIVGKEDDVDRYNEYHSKFAVVELRKLCLKNGITIGATITKKEDIINYILDYEAENNKDFLKV